ncbi:hypothetical protein [Ramlibacter sp. AN1133]|uniref:hypothetical protein n=1 Tax=Ramlibacter sp. AN1133 TaxID=3133429 RepID=UPI0030C3FE3A
MKKSPAHVPRTAAAAVLLLLAAQAAQAQTAGGTNAGPTVRGDRQTSITTQVQRNVPRAQRSDPTSRFRPADPLGGDDKPDVLLDIPNLSVDEIKLDVQNLQAHVSLDARVANLVKITAGVDASIDKVNLDIKGVKASVLLIVRLENVREIVTKTLDTLDKNPQLVERLLQTVDNTVGTVGGVANTALQPGGVISQTVNTLGQTVTRTVDTAGNLLERTVDQAGNVLSSRTVGRALDLPVLRETTNTAGQVVRQVRDASGTVLELTLDRAGQVVSSRVLSQAGAGGATAPARPGTVAPAPAR